MGFYYRVGSLVMEVLVSMGMLLLLLLVNVSAGNLKQEVEITWGEGRGQIQESGKVVTLSLDQYSGSGFQSKNEYLYGRFDMQLKLIPDNSAGTVTTFYLSSQSQGEGHDEIDFEFLGNVSGEPYTVHTNIYSQGKGNKEQQFKLWFDPTSSFHTYTIIWNAKRIIFLVDNNAIRVYKNQEEEVGIPFPTSQPMRIYCSLWNADDWATQGGRVKTDWKNAPFTVSYRNPNFSGKITSGTGLVVDSSQVETTTWQNRELDSKDRNRIRWVQQKHMIYNYCNDFARFPSGISAECMRSRF